MTEQAIHRETTEAGGLPGRSALSDWAQEVAALAKRWFIELGQEKLNLVFSVAQPAIWLVFFGVGIGRAVDKNVIGTSDYTGFTLPGIVAFTVIGSGVPAAMPLMWDKESGYLDKLMSMPISRSSIIVSRFVFQAILSAAQVLALAIVAVIFWLAMIVDAVTNKGVNDTERVLWVLLVVLLTPGAPLGAVIYFYFGRPKRRLGM